MPIKPLHLTITPNKREYVGCRVCSAQITATDYVLVAQSGAGIAFCGWPHFADFYERRGAIVALKETLRVD